MLVSSLMLGSCKKCKKKDCQNDASCSLLNNEAVCSCKDFYEGDVCDIETRSKYVGVYTGKVTYTFSGITLPTNTLNFSVESVGSTASKFKFSATDGSSTTTFNCKLTSETSFVLESVTGSSGAWEGSGTISTGNLSMSGNITSGSSKGTYKLSASR